MKNTAKISIKAILIGVLVDIGGTLIAVGVFAFIMAVIFASQGIPETEMESKLMSSLAFQIGGLIIGFGFLYLGSFIGARIAKSAEIMHASIIGAISVLFVLLQLALPFASSPLWQNIIAILLTLPIAIFGGYVAKCKGQEITV